MTRSILCCVALLGLGGCAVTPVALDPDQRKAQIVDDRAALVDGQEPLSGPITLYEAMARALRYNLDHRLQVMEEAVARGQLEVSRWEMLPDLVLSSGYTGRDNHSGASSRSLITRQQSVEPSTSSDRDVKRVQLGLTWNVLDFGLSYVRAQQAADRVLMAEERRQKVVHGIFQDVRRAYWRAVSAERLRRRLEETNAKVDVALAQLEQVQSERLENPLTTLTYQRELMDIKLQIETLERELSFAKTQLAALINLYPGETFQVEVPSGDLPIREVGFSQEEIEQHALENRPELREIAYEGRMLAKETRAALLSFLPGIRLELARQHSSNSFLFESSWYSWGAQVGFNLLKVFAAPAKFAEVDAQIALNDVRRLALSMTVITQVYVSLAQFEQDRRQLENTTKYVDTQSRILAQIRKARRAGRVSEQSVIREEMNALVSDVRRDIAFADLESSYAGVFVSMGMSPLPDSVSGDRIADLASAFRAHWEPE